jgi:hypothetical protein
MKLLNARRLLAPVAAGLVLFMLSGGLRPARAQSIPSPMMPGEWLGVLQSERDPGLFALERLAITGQDGQHFTGGLSPRWPIRLVSGELPEPPSLGVDSSDPSTAMTGVAANSGEWTLHGA